MRQCNVSTSVRECPWKKKGRHRKSKNCGGFGDIHPELATSCGRCHYLDSVTRSKRAASMNTTSGAVSSEGLVIVANPSGMTDN